jgi:glycosyltransferase involved in cell wall biosynthesis
LQNLDRKLFAPELWMLRGGEDMVPHALEAGVKLSWMSKSPTIVWPHALARLASMLIRERPQILYTMTVVPNIWGRLFAPLAQIPVVISSYRDLHPNQYELLMWRLSTRIICNAHTLKEELKRRAFADPNRVFVVPNAVDAEFFAPNNASKAAEPTVVFAGRLARVKDPLNLIEAFKLVIEKVPDARLEILGNGSLRQKIKNTIRNCSLCSSIEVVEGQLDIRPALSRAWVFVMPSRREAAPNAVLEAMSAGLPVVGTRVGGLPELIEDGVTGITVKPRDPRALADALITLLENESLRRSMGREGREKVLASYTIDRMIADTQRVMIEALNERCGGEA